MSSPPVPSNPTSTGIARWIFRSALSLVIYAVLLFISSGRLDWPGGWAYLGLGAFIQAVTTAALLKWRPDLIVERSQVREGTKNYDRILAPAVSVGGVAIMLITAGLDARFGWTPSILKINTAVFVPALLVAAASVIFVLWAMICNPFFAATVRIQTERGQHVINSGPYRIVRHPGYLGSVIFDLAAPLVLGSLWAFVPAAITVVLIFVRTALEDRTLQAELPGYRHYAGEVQHRLIPGIW